MADRDAVYDALGKLVMMSMSADSRTTVIPLNLAGEIMDLLDKPEAKPALKVLDGECPNCHSELGSSVWDKSGKHIVHFCYNCGQGVEWL